MVEVSGPIISVCRRGPLVRLGRIVDIIIFGSKVKIVGVDAFPMGRKGSIGQKLISTRMIAFDRDVGITEIFYLVYAEFRVSPRT